MTTPPEAPASHATPEDDIRWMEAALAMARRSLGRTWPNPSVGCVIVGENGVVGRGATQPGGRPHAERMALTAAGEAARGATVYVTLEPCSHYGVTSPCANALLEAGVARVVSALEDPDPRVAGQGHARLRAAGVDVSIGVGAAEAAEINRGYLLRRSEGRPFVTLKLAATLDGKIATQTGESQWITCELARKRAHLERARHDVVLVGAGTARADDPTLNVRLPGMAASSPIRAVADGSLSTPIDGTLAHTTPQLPLWMLHRADAAPERKAAFEALGAVLIEIPEADMGGLDIRAGLTALATRGVTRVFCEGGGRLAASLLREGLVDRLLWASAGAVIGGDGLPAVNQLGVLALPEAPRFELVAMERLGLDVLSEWRPSSPPD